MSLHPKHRGAFNELRAAAWLLEQGFDAFTSTSPHGYADMIAVKFTKAGAQVLLLDAKSSEHVRLKPRQYACGVQALNALPDGGFRVAARAVPPRSPVSARLAIGWTHCERCNALHKPRNGAALCCSCTADATPAKRRRALNIRPTGTLPVCHAAAVAAEVVTVNDAARLYRPLRTYFDAKADLSGALAACGIRAGSDAAATASNMWKRWTTATTT